jgi:hypothetical protein
MPRLCSQCTYYTSSGETVCPTCNKEMQLTFLPPPGQANATLPAVDLGPEPARVARRPRESAASQLNDMFRWMRANRMVVSSVLGVVMIAGGLLFGWGSQSLEGRFDQIEVGMDEREVRNILSPPSRGRKWRSPEWHNQPVLSTEGYASMKHMEATGTVTVEFMDGLVVRKSLEPTRSAAR